VLFRSLAQQLANQREAASGVDINQEAAKLLVFERMFQAMAKFIGAQDRAMQTLMDVV
jgi:flagellar hook-associated protein FlgK